MKKNQKKLSNEKSSIFPPVVAVLGHVDHGKTTLLDAIRKTDIAKGEHGAITQKIGASSVEIDHEGSKRRITFIDTPGHEAFKLMRGRGVQAADIALLVISLTDGVMPQTKEAIELLKSSKIPYIVVLTKSDLLDKQVEKIKGQLLKEEVLLEGKGGNVPFIEVSAKTKHNIKELLDLILLVFDIATAGKKAETQKNYFEAIVIESKLDPKAGPKATLVVKSGEVKVGDDVISENVKARVRSLINDKGERQDRASQGEAVEILGFDKVPQVGSLVHKKDEGSARQLPHAERAAHPTQLEDQKLSRSLSEGPQPSLIDNSKLNESGPSVASQVGSSQADKKDLLGVLIVADTQGSLEAIVNAVKDKINIIGQKTGDVSPADVLFAKSTGSIILSFNVKIKPDVAKLAEMEKVLLRNYSLIYEMLTEIEDFLEGKRLSLEEKIFGKAKVLARFPFEKQEVLGVGVLQGRIAKGDKIRLMRDENIIAESTIISLRQGKDSVSKVEKGQEAGILLGGSLDFTIGDMLISHS